MGLNGASLGFTQVLPVSPRVTLVSLFFYTDLTKGSTWWTSLTCVELNGSAVLCRRSCAVVLATRLRRANGSEVRFNRTGPWQVRHLSARRGLKKWRRRRWLKWRRFTGNRSVGIRRILALTDNKKIRRVPHRSRRRLMSIGPEKKAPQPTRSCPMKSISCLNADYLPYIYTAFPHRHARNSGNGITWRRRAWPSRRPLWPQKMCRKA